VGGLVVDPDLHLVCSLLEQDVLANVVTLKMLTVYSASMKLRLRQEGSAWALLALLPTSESHWDRKAYPGTSHIVFIDGNADNWKQGFLTELPPGAVVVKTGDPTMKAALRRRPGVVQTTSYRSFTLETKGLMPSIANEVFVANAHDPAAWSFFHENGYDPDELAGYFANGAHWFGTRTDGQLASACFVYQNYGAVWEIAGVYTREDLRKRGLGKCVVAAALSHLAKRHLIPRYQVKWNNDASVALAKACGLVAFLQVDHYLLPPDGLAGAT
jgi:hypothetical protein